MTRTQTFPELLAEVALGRADVDPDDGVRKLVDRSSFGDPAARSLADRTPPDVARRILDRVDELDRARNVVAGLALIESDAHPPVLRVTLHRAGCPARFLADPELAAVTCACGADEP